LHTSCMRPIDSYRLYTCRVYIRSTKTLPKTYRLDTIPHEDIPSGHPRSMIFMLFENRYATSY